MTAKEWNDKRDQFYGNLLSRPVDLCREYPSSNSSASAGKAHNEAMLREAEVATKTAYGPRPAENERFE